MNWIKKLFKRKHVAVELSKVLGGAPEVWFNLSKSYHDRKGVKNENQEA